MLQDDFDTLHSPHIHPWPICPHCEDGQVRFQGMKYGYPYFYCLPCRRVFNRRTGTPYSNNQHAEQQRKLIRYLSLPLPITQLADLVGLPCSTTKRQIKKLRERAQALDASGRLAASIRAGAKPTATTPCLQCGAPGVSADGALNKCPQCGRLVSIRRPVTECNGLLLAGPWEWLTIARSVVSP
jgi:transposase-like protein